ncbi:MAG: hypothetical protein JW798_18695, partial [Prolixibacteraceae bacterium]|nr:hypothetical protein [Prolixibacteraceae bacterium]
YFKMTSIEIKSNLHKLIDSIDDETRLKKAYRLIETLTTVNEEGTWSKLSEKEKEELLDIEKGCHDPAKLIDHEEMKKRHKKWL